MSMEQQLFLIAREYWASPRNGEDLKTVQMKSIQAFCDEVKRRTGSVVKNVTIDRTDQAMYETLREL